MRNRVNVAMVFCWMLFLTSCQERKATPKPTTINNVNSVSLQITASAGDKWVEEAPFLALPFNLAEAGGQNHIVIAESLKKGSSVYAYAIAKANVLENDSTITYYLSIPDDKSLRAIDSDDFLDFASVHSGAKWIIEQFITNRKGLQDSKFVGWEDLGE